MSSETNYFDSRCDIDLTMVCSSILVMNSLVWFHILGRSLYWNMDRLEWQIEKQRLQEKKHDEWTIYNMRGIYILKMLSRNKIIRIFHFENILAKNVVPINISSESPLLLHRFRLLLY